MTTSYTFPSTGITVQVKPVNPLVAVKFQREWTKKHPKPAIPVHIAKTGPNQTAEIEFETQEYFDAEKAWQDELDAQIDQLYVDLAVQCEVDVAAVAEVRAAFAARGSEYPGNDKYVFLTAIAVGTVQEWNDLVALIDGTVRVSNEAVEAASAAFQDNLPGHSPTPLEAAA